MGKYFDEEVDQAIFEFQKCTDEKRRNELCRDYILPAFEKLSSYWFHRLPLINNKETIDDCTSYLYEKIDMFDESKGKRGFAYFNMIARHWYFQRLKAEKREVLRDSEIEIYDANDMIETSRSAAFDALIDNSLEEEHEKKEFLLLLKEELPKWEARARKENEKKVIGAIITLFDDIDNIDLFKKKTLLHYMREITGLSSKQIALNLNKIKKRFIKFRSKYNRGRI